MNVGSKSEPPSGRLKDRFKEATRSAILEAAEEVFARDGIERARIDAIAAHAGVSVGTIYNHIGDRDAVFTAVLGVRRAEIVASLEKTIGEVDEEDVRTQLEKLARTALEHVDRHRGFFAIVLESAEGPRHIKSSETVQSLEAIVKAIVKRGARDGSLRSDLGRNHVLLFVGMLRTAIRDRIREDGGGTSPTVWARTITSLFLDGASARGAK